jgi:hypothetical protein
MKLPRITINGNHQYNVEGVGDKMPSTSTIANHSDVGSSGLVRWSVNMALQQQDAEAPNRHSARQIKTGVDLHALIEGYIRHGHDMNKIIGQSQKLERKHRIKGTDELKQLYGAWQSYMGELGVEFTNSEYKIYHPRLSYGGTIDAIGTQDGETVLYDWKSTNKLTGGGNLSTPKTKHAVQLGGYQLALEALSRKYEDIPQTTKAFVVYVYKDTHLEGVQPIELYEVDLAKAKKAFIACLRTYRGVLGGKKALYVTR